MDFLQVKMPERVTIKRVRIPFAESLRFPGEGKSAQGKSEPKVRPKGVADGQQVNIPAPPRRCLSNGVTQKGRFTHCWISAAVIVGGSSGKSGLQYTENCGEARLRTSQLIDPTLPRKTSSESSGDRTVNRHR